MPHETPDLGFEHHAPRFRRLLAFLGRVPAFELNDSKSRGVGSGEEPDGSWWIKFSLDIHHPLAWHVVQEFAHVLNGVSLSEKLASVFKPVSPPPYLNGGPDEFLSWVIECAGTMTPDEIAEWLEGRLPRPVDDESMWRDEDAN